MRTRIFAGLGVAALATVGLAAPANAVTDDTADVYLVHAFPGVTVDIDIADGAIVLDGVEPGVAAGPGLASPNVDVADLGDLAPGDYNVVITPTDGGDPVFDDTLTLEAGVSYTAVAHPLEGGDFTVSVFENQLAVDEAGNGLITVRHTADVGAVNVFSDGDEIAGPLSNGDEGVLELPAATYPAVTAGPEGATDAIDLGNVELPAATNIFVHAFGPDADETFSAVVFTIGGLTTPDGVPAGNAGLVDEGAGAGLGFGAAGAALLLMVLAAVGIMVRRQTVSAQR